MSKLDVCIVPISGKKNFTAIIKKSVKYQNDYLRAFISFRQSCSEDEKQNCIQYAVGISKRTAKKAVIRNRIKRLLRESLRLALQELEEEAFNIASIVLYWTKYPERLSKKYKTKVQSENQNKKAEEKIRPSSIRLQHVLIPVKSILEIARKS